MWGGERRGERGKLDNTGLDNYHPSHVTDGKEHNGRRDRVKRFITASSPV